MFQFYVLGQIGNLIFCFKTKETLLREVICKSKSKETISNASVSIIQLQRYFEASFKNIGNKQTLTSSYRD